MKKLLSIGIALMTLVAFTVPKADAQSQPPSGYVKTTHGTAGPTVNDTVSTVAKSHALNTAGYWSQLLLQVNLNKISGTAGGVVRVFAGLDGVNYPVRVANNDSLVVANVSAQFKIFDVGPTKYPYYKVVYTPTGTMSVKFQTYFFTRKYSGSY